ncbi:terpene synthase family protein [Pendulispora rubella]|uniref:Terpene synthase n=1 Tax=Pendulispora rubella TaxID=2741070 RepID=A0ABZ2KY85_9BACT
MAFFLACRYAMWTCLCFPLGDAQRVRDLCDASQYFFVIDDDFSDASRPKGREGEPAIFCELMAVLRGESVAKDREYIQVLREVWSRLRTRMPLAQQTRYIEAVRDFLRGFAVEVEARRSGTCFNYVDYMGLRRDSVSGKPYFILAEYAMDIDLSEEFAAYPELDALNRTALDQLILVNDLFSFRKEYFAGDSMNAISVLRRSGGLDLQGAVSVVCDTVNDLTRQFVHDRDRLLSSDLGRRPHVRAYATAIGQIMAGNLHWSFLTPRYHGAGYTWNHVTTGTVLLDRERTTFLASSSGE